MTTRDEPRRSLGMEQLSDGWAGFYVYRDRPFRQYDRFNEAEEGARDAMAGAWGMCEGDFHRPAT